MTTLGFFTINSRTGDAPEGTLQLVEGTLIATGCASIFTESLRKKHNLDDAGIWAEFDKGWNNGHFYVKEI